MGGWVKILLELLDFMFKATIAYAATAEGKKELDDIAEAWEAAANNEDNAGTVQFSVSDNPVRNSGAGSEPGPVSATHRPVSGSKPAK